MASANTVADNPCTTAAAGGMPPTTRPVPITPRKTPGQRFRPRKYRTPTAIPSGTHGTGTRAALSGYCSPAARTKRDETVAIAIMHPMTASESHAHCQRRSPAG